MAAMRAPPVASPSPSSSLELCSSESRSQPAVSSRRSSVTRSLSGAALIGVVLGGLSIGYWAGGALADRFPRAELLVGAITLGATGVLAIPFLDEAILEAVVGWDPGPRADPLLASVVLFGAPSIVLASVTPIAVRLRARELTHLGRTAGRLFSISTVGSIVGTFVTSFWLIPELGTDQGVGIAAAVLFIAAAVVAIAERLVGRSTRCSRCTESRDLLHWSCTRLNSAGRGSLTLRGCGRKTGLGHH
jgi:MFS family permease